MLEALGATSAYPVTPLRWLSSSRLTLPGRFRQFVAKASRLTYPYLYRMDRASRALVSLGILALAWVSQGGFPRRISALTRGSNCVIWDSSEVSKKYMEPLLHLLREVPSYSIRHGIGIQRDPEETDSSWRAPEKSISRLTTVFTMAWDDMPVWEKTIGVSREQIRATGIYRHHPDWIRTITSQGNQEDERSHPDTVLVVSRGPSSSDRYLPRERLLDYLADIRTVAERFNLRLVVKPHPKEMDFSVYSDAFGTASKNFEWEVSNHHLAILARRAVFAVSFFSGSCLDLTAYGVPTIERLNLVGLPKYDFPTATRDSTGAPVLEYRQHGHVLGSSTSEEFFLRVDEVMRDRSRAMRQLESAYRRHYVHPPMNPGMLARQISENCTRVLGTRSNVPK